MRITLNEQRQTNGKRRGGNNKKKKGSNGWRRREYNGKGWRGGDTTPNERSQNR